MKNLVVLLLVIALSLVNGCFAQTQSNIIPTGQIYGLCFGPYMDGQNPNFGTQISESQIRERLEILRPYCRAIRIYGSTDGLENIGRIAKEMGFFVVGGVWLSNNIQANRYQMDKAIEVAKSGGYDVLCVGSEVLLRHDLPAGNENSTPGDSTLIGYIKEAKTAVDINVTYVDTWEMLENNPQVVKECEGFIMANFYPYWDGICITSAIKQVKNNYRKLTEVINNKEIVIGETGWPTEGDNVGLAIADSTNSGKYFYDVINWTREKKIKLFYFEAFDEHWKSTFEGPQGANWGILDSSGVIKPIFKKLILGG